MTAILWLRRDLRLHDHPALGAAAAGGDGRVVALFVVDPQLWGPAGSVRRAYLLSSLKELSRRLDDRLLLRVGDPVDIVPEVAAAADAAEVHVSADHGPYGTRRDRTVSEALGCRGLALRSTGSPYAVSPGLVLKADRTPYRVFTPFLRSWCAHGWPGPARTPPVAPEWVRSQDGDAWPMLPDLERLRLPPAGEQAALDRWEQLLSDGTVHRYAETRDRPDLDGTSQLSAAIRWGEIHPRTLLAELGEGPGPERLRAELGWREFCADLLHHHPGSARTPLRDDLHIESDRGPEATERLAAWVEGRTGYPFVDAGMRQLLSEGWMHNRLRMVTASFLVKDLHLDWRLGARHFMRWLRDGDLASNQHNWQWVAGIGTDAAPYTRIFNPVAQGLRLDPLGDYVRRHVPELRAVEGPAVHEPWTLRPGLPPGYPGRIVDHATERAESVRRYDAARRRIGP
jgi:deoxyribodipyrimidine photo-lyase